jgi:hypothetical protein
MEHIFSVEAHAEHTGWNWCYEVSEIGTFFEKKSVGYQAKKGETRQLDVVLNVFIVSKQQSVLHSANPSLADPSLSD